MNMTQFDKLYCKFISKSTSLDLILVEDFIVIAIEAVHFDDCHLGIDL
jgi:hypothetical protein